MPSRRDRGAAAEEVGQPWHLHDAGQQGRGAKAGGRHDWVLADLANGQLRKKLPALRKALEGRFGAHHGLLLAEILARIDHMDEAICRLSQEVARLLAPFSRCWPCCARSRASAPASLSDPGKLGGIVPR